jgi:uncharacterized small protein (DUF1192 family)
MPEISEALKAAFEQHEQAEPVQETVAKPAQETAQQEPEARPRDDLGRFAPKAEQQASKQEAPKQEAPEVDEAPKSWRKEYREHYSRLDPEVRKYIKQREEEAERGIVSYSQRAKIADEYERVAKPYEPIMQQLGVTPVQAFQALLDADYRLRTSDPATKAQLFAQLAQQYGVSLDDVRSPPQMDPTVSYLQQEIARLKAQAAQWERSQDAAYLDEISRFAQQHEDFETVREDMALLLQSGKATTLEDAYQKAIRLNDETFQRWQESQRQAEEQRRKQEAAAAANQARAAAVQVRGSPVTSTTGSAKDIRGALEEAFNRFG